MRIIIYYNLNQPIRAFFIISLLKMYQQPSIFCLFTNYINESLMKIFENYLNKQKKLLKNTRTISKQLDMVVVIPCFNEPYVINTINSLINNVFENIFVEIIVVVNSPEEATITQIEQNYKTRFEIKNLNVDLANMHVSILNIENIPRKEAGVGYARKIGMDEAVRLFYAVNNANGIIVSLDADCLVQKNYLQNIYNAFNEFSSTNTAIIQIEHQVHDDDNPVLYNAGILYELYLRYYSEALRFTGFPYPYITIGSGFAVRADAYVKSGGMNKKNAGEDFYFLQKVFMLDGIKQVNNTTVYPEIRDSDRVIFGTGPAIKRIMQDGCLKTYSLEAFLDLKSFFVIIDNFYLAEEKAINQYLEKIPKSIRQFLLENNFYSKIIEINVNTSSLKNFRKRFFNWFNAFLIIKYMHYVHPAYYTLNDIKILAENLYQLIGKEMSNEVSAEELLLKYRILQKSYD